MVAPMAQTDLKQVESHFAFGENWADFAGRLDEGAIAEAEKGLLKLIDRDDLQGRSFLDIGCGSGVHSLAALRLGAARVVAVDIDPVSAATAKAVLGRFAPGGNWTVEEISVFDLDPKAFGQFDIVYSWGVLHHTGKLDRAMLQAASMVDHGGLLVLALYRPTTLDPFWVREKRWYMRASPSTQRRARAAYLYALRLGLLVTGRSYGDYVRSYRSRRGMSLEHDVHDWLGGYPYEPIGGQEVELRMQDLGFKAIKTNARPANLGLLGSGCDEFVYRRI
jgi:2-polyprenyl-6-hydroxyphenyl methylase/3-demethylubiquinone-9 3-methyltransferase